ncbi:penicillin-binding protein 1A [Bacillus litorisediminis]|uniref:penicillin-binding protein 1A n=1 Tax=Bacillus litorisediminis TaxID=2922713 RepID=UPI001FB028D6|nr:penicillin-binding protein 1A [Bacillus litorisediminis]
MSEQYKSREQRRKQLAAQKGKNKESNKGLIKKIALWIVAIGILGMIAGGSVFAYWASQAPELDPALLKDPVSSEVYAMDGTLIREIGTEQRDVIAFKDIPDVVKEAFLATEDARFYKHKGIDVIRIGGAVIANITDGFGAEGASTITQQVIKNSFLSPEKTIERKVQEMWLAFQLEQQYEKDEIFEMYLNKIFMGENIYGVATASNYYFGKPLDQLSADTPKEVALAQAAMLAGLPQSPNRYDPFENPEEAKQRRNTVLYLMNKHGYITKEEMEKAQAVEIAAMVKKTDPKLEEEKDPYEDFVDYVIDEVQKKYPDYDIFSDGLKIYTTLDPNAQKFVYDALETNQVVEYPDEEFQAGITLLDTQTGAIRAIGGGRNQEVQRGFNYATDLERQPGSTIKPILDYGPAIEYLKWSTYHQIVDEPYTYSKGTPVGNWDDDYYGQMSIRRALAMSRNIPAVKALQEVGLENAQKFAVQLGLPLQDEIYESYAIGGLEKGVSPLQMAGAYAAFGNEGVYTEPYAITKIVSRDGTEIETKPKSDLVMQDYTAFMISDMLKSVFDPAYDGTATVAQIPGLPMAGKTGTTNYTEEDRQKHGIDGRAVPDSWMVGYTTKYTTAIWTGYSNYFQPVQPGNDQKIARHLYKAIMQKVHEGVDTPDFTVPKSVVESPVEVGSTPAKLPSEYTPENKIVYEWFVKGTEPKEVSEAYDIPDAVANLAAVYDEETNEILLTWDYDTKNKNQKVQFDIEVSLNQGPMQPLTSTTEKNLRLQDAMPGAVYTFRVTAADGETKSEPAEVTVEIPEAEQDNPLDDLFPGDGNGSNGGQPGQGNGNGNGNGGNDGDGDGDGDGEGDGNSPPPDDGEGDGEGDIIPFPPPPDEDSVEQPEQP